MYFNRLGSLNPKSLARPSSHVAGAVLLLALGAGGCSVHMSAQGKGAASTDGTSSSSFVFKSKPRATGIKRSTKGSDFHGHQLVSLHGSGSVSIGGSGSAHGSTGGSVGGSAGGSGSVKGGGSAGGSGSVKGGGSVKGSASGSGSVQGEGSGSSGGGKTSKPAESSGSGSEGKKRDPIKPPSLSRPVGEVEPRETPDTSESKTPASEPKKPEPKKPEPKKPEPKKPEPKKPEPKKPEPPVEPKKPEPAPVDPPANPPSVPETPPTQPEAEPPQQAEPPAAEPVPEVPPAALPPIDPPPAPPENAFGYERPIKGCFEGIVYPLKPRSRQLPRSYEELPAISVVYACEWDIPTREWKTGFPGIPDHFEWFAIRYAGSFFVEAGGTWTFRISSDDGTRLLIDGEPVIVNDGIHPPKIASANVELTPGDHEMVLEYFQGPRYLINLQLFATPPGGEEGIFSVR